MATYSPTLPVDPDLLYCICLAYTNDIFDFESETHKLISSNGVHAYTNRKYALGYMNDLAVETIKGLRAMSTKPKRPPPPPKTKHYFENIPKKKSNKSYNNGKVTKIKRG